MRLDWKTRTHALGTRAKHAGRMARLTVALSAEQETLQCAYTEIGRHYYESRCDGSDPLLTQLCAEVRASSQRIAAMQSEMDALRAND